MYVYRYKPQSGSIFVAQVHIKSNFSFSERNQTSKQCENGKYTRSKT